MEDLLPPSYIKLPPSIAYAEVDDGAIVTMARVLALCWEQRYRQSAPYTPDQLADLVRRPRATLYRHLNKAQELGWLMVHHSGRRLVLQPLVHLADEHRPSADLPTEQRYHFPDSEDGRDAPGRREVLGQALREAGIVGKVYRELVAMDLDPAWVWAWHKWTQHPDRAKLTNRPGLIVAQLRAGEAPPEEYLDLVSLTAEEEEQLRWARWRGTDDLPDKLYWLFPLWREFDRQDQ